MDLSIIIVNYNVKHFLEQCLTSVRAAVKGMAAEVIVVDNDSDDKSLAYLEPLFKEVRFISSAQNLGFAKACNIGWKGSSGKFVLFLNPDTIVPEDCFRNCISFMEQTPDAGAIGIRMLDGSGKFLKESKRSFPSPVVSFYKLAGLSKLFPHSSVFGRYHLGHLEEDKVHQVEVLAGAFIMVRSELLQATGGFDEKFFMYGEDVDLSYRLQLLPCGNNGDTYKNYYYPHSPIIHFKGESTRKGSMNYVRMFYSAMSLFVQKHYGAGRAGTFKFFIHIAIWLRAGYAAIGRFVRAFGLPILDAILILISFWLVKELWVNYVKPEVQYDNKLLWIALPAFTVVYLVAAYYAGLYDRWYRRVELAQSTLLATMVVLSIYSLLPEGVRFSRGIMLFGGLTAFLLIGILRRILIYAAVISRFKPNEEAASTLVVASSKEYAEVKHLLTQAGLQHKLLGRVAVNDTDKENALGSWSELPQLIKTIPFKELVLVAGTVSYSEIIRNLNVIPKGIRIKWHGSGTHSIVGSDSKDNSGEALSTENALRIADPSNRRLKRLSDVVVAILSIVLWPVLAWMVKQPLGFIKNSFQVLAGQKTWMGYASDASELPQLRPGVLGNNGLSKEENSLLPTESLQMMDYWYARDYSLPDELRKLVYCWKKLGV